MSDSSTIDADAFRSRYSVKQIGTAVAFAFLLHGVLLGAYFVLGSEKKGPGKTAEKVEKKDDSKAAAPAKPGESGKNDLLEKPADTAGKTTPPAPPADAKKNTETAKPGEIPNAPDSDIDNILKAK
ncbi:MAG TPA: hypothetical protein VEK08_13510 [Planctomycetota bacterium]|nr:hypothetical protein [Planctomycetota bacterium]